jgi:hypothetical protein
MADSPHISGRQAAVQAVAAFAVFGALAGGLWVQDVFEDKSPGYDGPAVCSNSHETLPPAYASPAELCQALNRPDLPNLLAVPGEKAKTASGSTTRSAIGGDKSLTPKATVDVAEYTVELSATYDRLKVSKLAGLVGGGAQRESVLGHPAVLYMDRTLSIRFNLGGGKAESGAGGIAWCLLVAKDAKDGGGYYELDLWRQDNATPDKDLLLRLAEEVLPTVPDWTAVS